MKLLVESFCVGQWMTNCYVIRPAGKNECWIIDAGFEPHALIEYIKNNKLLPEKVIITHAHLDHIGGLGEILKIWPDIEILLHQNEREFLSDPFLNLSAMAGVRLLPLHATDTLKHNQKLELDSIEFRILHTPGHSPGSICLYNESESVVFAGDTLFAGSVGRSDFPNSDGQTLLTSINKNLMGLPDKTRVLPGHGAETTIGIERETNPFL